MAVYKTFLFGLLDAIGFVKYYCLASQALYKGNQVLLNY